MKDTNYAFCVARIRALENKLLTKQDISTLLGQKDFPSALDYLSTKGYYCEDGDIESIVRAEEDRLSVILNESVPDKNELKSLYIINDFFNIKALVKCIIESKNPLESFVYPTTVIYNENQSSLPEEIFESLGELHRKTAFEAYSYAIKSGNGRYCDIMIDKAAISSLVALYQKRKSGLCGDIAALLADTANIKTAFRCIFTDQKADFISEAIGECCKLDRKKLIDAAVTGVDGLCSYLATTNYSKGAEIYKTKPSDFEKWCDNEIISKLKSSIYTSFGFDPVVSYYYRKNLEIKTVRMILTAIKSDIDKQLIIERVRSIYA